MLAIGHICCYQFDIVRCGVLRSCCFGYYQITATRKNSIYIWRLVTDTNLRVKRKTMALCTCAAILLACQNVVRNGMSLPIMRIGQ